jgi:hypothetical protein
MPIQDLFVGAVALALGIAIIAGSAMEADWLMQRRLARLLVERLGQRTARIVLGVVGAALIALGALVASGWRVDWS